jgi:protein-S-isoprenylcysteine O-methyltransferase Ste14
MTPWQKIARRIRVPLGFAFAVFYFWMARPTARSMVIGSIFIVAGLALRAAAAGHVIKDRQLTTTGPYAYTRHPLYLGSLIMAAGFAVAARSIWIVLAMVVIFIGVYLPVIRVEEYHLHGAFEDRFNDYARQVPLLLPRLRPFESGGAFSAERYWSHREYNALLGASVLIAALVIKMRFWR